MMMENKNKRGMTLFELVVAVVILSVVLFAASGLLINTQQSFTNIDKGSAATMITVQGVLEQMVNRIAAANEVKIYDAATTEVTSGGVRIQIRVDDNDPSITTDDKIYTYKLVNREIRYAESAMVTPTEVLAKDVDALSFSFVPTTVRNCVKIILKTKPESGLRENLETTVFMSGRRSSL